MCGEELRPLEGMQLIELKEEWRSFGRSAFGALPTTVFILYFIFNCRIPRLCLFFLVFVLGHIMAYWVATFLAPMNHEARQLQLKHQNSTSALYL